MGPLLEFQVKSQTISVRCDSTVVRPAICLLLLGTWMALFLPVFHLSVSVNAQEKAPLKLIATTPLPGFSGDFDHFAADVKGNRLFLAAEDHKTVEVFDLRTGRRLKSITGFGTPHSIIYLPATDRILVTDGEKGTLEMLRGSNYA